MNKQRRLLIMEIQDQMLNIECSLRQILSAEEWAYCNMPDNLKGSNRGCESEEIQYSLEEAIEQLHKANERIIENLKKNPNTHEDFLLMCKEVLHATAAVADII